MNPRKMKGCAMDGMTQAELIASVEGYWARAEANRLERLALAPRIVDDIRRYIFPQMLAAGFAVVEVDYDGFADEGSTEGVRGFRFDGSTIDQGDNAWLIPLETDSAQWGAHQSFEGTLTGVVEDIVEWLLEVHHDGYENNDGGYGIITLDIEGGTVTIAHSQRRTETDDSLVSY
jgi:hypothetical protein